MNLTKRQFKSLMRNSFEQGKSNVLKEVFNEWLDKMYLRYRKDESYIL